MIVYFSGTGNSRYCAQLLAARLADELIDAFTFLKSNTAAKLHSERPWVFVTPTYAWQLPHLFTKLLQSSSFTGSREAYFVMTCGSETGNAAKGLNRLCAEKGFDYRGLLTVVMPENYVAMFAVPEAEEAAQIIARARPVLELGADCIRRKEVFPPQKPSVIDRAKTMLANPIFYRFFIKANSFYASDACSGCGKCVKNCPLNNIRLSGGKPAWGKDCTHCMACICGCPAKAIEYGRNSLGKPRYQCDNFKD